MISAAVQELLKVGSGWLSVVLHFHGLYLPGSGLGFILRKDITITIRCKL